MNRPPSRHGRAKPFEERRRFRSPMTGPSTSFCLKKRKQDVDHRDEPGDGGGVGSRAEGKQESTLRALCQQYRGAEGGVSSVPDPTRRRATVKMSDPYAPSELEKRSTETTGSVSLKFSVLRLALAFLVAGISDIIGAFASWAPPIGWAVDVVTAALLFAVLGWQWLLLPGLVLEAIPGVGVLPFWLLVVGAVAVLGTPRPKLGQR